MLARFILSILTLGSFSSASHACDCVPAGPFLKVAPHTSFVALVKVTRYLSFKNIGDKPTPMSMEVEVIDVYKGFEKRKTITVWGDPGHLCRPYLSVFEVGEFYLIAFNPSQPEHGHNDEKATDYSISNCGAYWLMADPEKNMVAGNIDGDERTSKMFPLSFVKSMFIKELNKQ